MAPPMMSTDRCSLCLAPLPVEWAANLHADGRRSCLGTCRPLRLFESSCPDWVVAHDPEDANRVWCEWAGERPEDYAADDWAEVPPGHDVKIWIKDGKASSPDEGAELRALAPFEIVTMFGRGFVATSEWA